MKCPKCQKDHGGYRCPLCGSFSLDYVGDDIKGGSLYYTEIKRAERRNLIRSIPGLLILFGLYFGLVFGVAFYMGADIFR